MTSRFGPDGLPGLVALDLDGTLLTSDKRLTPRTRTALRELAARGVTVVLCTGRPPRSALPYARAVGLDHPLICFNGALRFEPAGGGARVRHHLDPEVAREAVTRLRASFPRAMLGLESDGRWFLDPSLHARRTSEARLGPEEPDGVGPVETFLDATAVKLLAREQDASAEELARPLEGLPLYRTWSNPRLLELLHPDVSKRGALEELCRELGVDRSQVAAFGDQRNDVEMLAWAGVGVAVANAEPEARRAADRVIASNDAEGVARTLEAWLAPPRATGPHQAPTRGG